MAYMTFPIAREHDRIVAQSLQIEFGKIIQSTLSARRGQLVLAEAL
jgi:hypothetical protein